MNHCRRHFLEALRARELVGVGEEVALERLGLRRQIRDELGLGFGNMQKIGCRPEPGVLHRLGDVEHRVAFGNGDYVEVDIAARDALVNLWQTCGPLETIFAGLQGWLGVQYVPQPENELAADHSRPFQLRSNSTRRISGTQQQRTIGRRRKRDIELPSGPAGNGENDNEKQFDQRAQGSSVKGFSEPQMENIYDHKRTAIQEHNVSADKDMLAIRRRRRQLPFKIDGNSINPPP
jgi:hypothetical protein